MDNEMTNGNSKNNNNSYYNDDTIQTIIALASSGEWKNNAASFIEQNVKMYKEICRGSTLLPFLKRYTKDHLLTSMSESIINDILRAVNDLEKVMFNQYIGLLEPSSNGHPKIRKFTITNKNRYEITTTEEFNNLLNLLGMEQLTYLLVLLFKIKYDYTRN